MLPNYMVADLCDVHALKTLAHTLIKWGACVRACLFIFGYVEWVNKFLTIYTHEAVVFIEKCLIGSTIKMKKRKTDKLCAVQVLF